MEMEIGMGMGIRCLLACARARFDCLLFAIAFLFEDAYGR